MKVVFVDRDGVINEDRADYVKHRSEFHPIPGSIEALKQLTDHGYAVIVVTNQSVIHRHLVSSAELEAIHRHMAALVMAKGGVIKAVYYCPHSPEANCECRKPKPGLIWQAQADHGLTVSDACMIGDSLKDIQCAKAAGCGLSILVRTGHGKETEQTCTETGLLPDYIANDLAAAVRWLVDKK
jgi:D-glycero-D-manno-heptose 1,7-bisphosphate phosphatase